VLTTKRRPFSRPRSSNRTGPFRASGFPMEFTARLTQVAGAGQAVALLPSTRLTGFSVWSALYFLMALSASKAIEPETSTSFFPRFQSKNIVLKTGWPCVFDWLLGDRNALIGHLESWYRTCVVMPLSGATRRFSCLGVRRARIFSLFLRLRTALQ
jgi:hypothetical protein